MSAPSRLFGALIGMLAALPGPTLAEGNRLVFDCQVLAPVGGNEAQDATQEPKRVSFTIAPVKTDRDGSGDIQATGPGGGPYAGVTAAHQGPFAWTAGTILNTLTVEGTVADGRALVLWHRLDQAQADVPPAGHLTKLLCEVS